MAIYKNCLQKKSTNQQTKETKNPKQQKQKPQTNKFPSTPTLKYNNNPPHIIVTAEAQEGSKTKF